jgi:hypothetical protein
MTPDEIKTRIVNEIKLHGYNDQFIDRGEERAFIQTAIQLGVNVEDALAALRRVCTELGYLLESDVWAQTEARVTAAGRAGRIDRATFDRIATEALATLRGKKSEGEVRAMVVTLMERTGHNRVKAGWLKNWYKELKQELGIA